MFALLLAYINGCFREILSLKWKVLWLRHVALFASANYLLVQLKFWLYREVVCVKVMWRYRTMDRGGVMASIRASIEEL